MLLFRQPRDHFGCSPLPGVDQAGEAGDSRVLEDFAKFDPGFESLIDLSDKVYSHDRVPAQLEEIMGHAQTVLRKMQQLSPYLQQLLLVR